MSKPTPTLEQRILAALDNPDASSAELSEIIAAAEQFVAATDAKVAEMRSLASDLIATPSAEAAHTAVIEADQLKTRRDRVNGALPRLRAALTQALHDEACALWAADLQRVQLQLDQAVAAFRRYPELASEIAAIFTLAAQTDQAIDQLNASAPDGCHERLRSVELTARGLERFDRDRPCLTGDTILPEWDLSCRDIWPPRSLKTGSPNAFAASYAASLALSSPPGGGDGGDWWKELAARDAAKRADTTMADYYTQQTAAQQARENREAAERFAAHQPGVP